MVRFILGRTLLLILGLVVASLLIFLTLRVLPGDIAQVIGGLDASPEQIERIRDRLGLDRSPTSQYFDWLVGLLRFDLGTSLLTGQPVADQLADRFEVTLPLTLLSLLISLLIALPLGVFAALKAERASGTITNVGAQTLAAVPALWLGLLLILLLSKANGVIPLLPSQGFPRQGWDRPAEAFASILLPALTVGIIEGAALLRFVRSAALTALSQDYVRTAAAKGLTRTRALIRHGLPNAGLSIISVAALQIAGLITGAVLVENLFNLPGVGRMLVADVGSRDLPAVQSEVFFLTALVLIIGFVVDIVHRLIDPRQRVQDEVDA